jgi:heme-binding protein
LFRKATQLLLAAALMFVAAQMVAAQFAPVALTNPPVRNDLAAPPEIKSILRRACYDCHSNETRWPWYSGVAPASWLIRDHVLEGRRRLNFSVWGDYAYDPGTEAQKLNEIAKFAANGKMPPWYYRMTHPGARLTTMEREAVAGWAIQKAGNQPLPR